MTAWSFKRALKAAAIAVLAVVFSLVALLGLLIWWGSAGVFSSEDFDPEKWRAPTTDAMDGTCYRGGMAEDVRGRLLVPGTSREEVERVLGRPDFKGPSEYRYVLGMCSGLGIDYDDLHVFFDDAGGVTHSSIIQH